MEKRVFGLDLMRTVAILLVVYGHGSHVLPQSWRTLYEKFYLKIDGVSIFFVLSGFLIGNILIKKYFENQLNIKGVKYFWWRRWLRTLPNYYLMILGILIARMMFPSKVYFDFSWKYWVFLQSFLIDHYSFFGESWSLCVEEFFYLLFPVSLWIIGLIVKNKKYAFWLVMVVFLVGPVLVRMWLYKNGFGLDDIDLYYRKSTILRMDSIAWGVMGAYLYKFKHKMWTAKKNTCLFIGLSYYLIISIILNIWPINRAFWALGNDLLAIMSSFLLLPFLSTMKETSKEFLNKMVIKISNYSYSMYIVNLTLIQGMVMPALLKHWGWRYSTETGIVIFRYGLYWFLVLGTSMVLYKYFEKPILVWRDKITGEARATARAYFRRDY